MNIKNRLKKSLSPSQLKKIKWGIMQIKYLKSIVERKYGVCQENKDFITDVKVIKKSGKHVFFGYYDLQQVDKEQKKMLVHIVDKNKANPSVDKADIAIVELENEKINTITSTKAWSWQQGSRLRWHPSNSNLIIFNDIRDNKYVTVVWNIRDNKEQEIFPIALYDISSSLNYGVGVNFSRLQRLRPGYGYSVIEDKTANIEAPEDDGVWIYDIVNKKQKLVVSLSELKEKSKVKDGYEHYINHVSIAPSNDKFIFFHIWTSTSSSEWNMNLYVMDMKNNMLTCLEDKYIASHYCWKNENEILVTTAAMNGKTPMYILYDISKKSKVILEGEMLTKDGHPSYINGEDNFISDTYPINCMQQVFYQNKNKSIEIAKLYSDPRMFDDMRCDLHPRITKENNLITVDSTFQNCLRQVVLLKLKTGVFENEK